MKGSPRVVIYVEGGLVQGVYVSDPDISVEVIDADTDDADELAENDKEIKALARDVEEKKLIMQY